MNAAVISILAEQIRLDQTLISQPRRLRALLNDLAGDHRRECNLLVLAAEQDIATTLADWSGVVDGFVYGRCVQLLVEAYGLTVSAARWAVTAWAQALGKSLSAELLVSQPAASVVQSAATLLELQQTLETRHKLNLSLAWLPDGRELACGGDAGRVHIWVLASDKRLIAAPATTLSAHSAWVTGLDWSNSQLISTGMDYACLWRSSNYQLEHSIAGNFLAARWNPISEQWALLSSHKALISSHKNHPWSKASSNNWRSLGAAHYESMAWSDDGQTLALGGVGVLELWRVSDGRLLHLLQGANQTPFCLDWSAQHRLASGGTDGLIEVWQPAMRRVEQQWQQGAAAIRCLEWSPDGRILASGDGAGTLTLWQEHNPQPLVTLHAHAKPIYSLRWHPSGGLLTTASGDGTIKLWRVQAG